MRILVIAIAVVSAALIAPLLADEDLERAHRLCLAHAVAAGPRNLVVSEWERGYEGCADVHKKWLDTAAAQVAAERARRAQDDESFLRGFIGRGP